MGAKPVSVKKRTISRLASAMTSIATDRETSGLVKSWGESLLHEFLEAGFLKDIPTVGVFFKVAGLPSSIKDLIFMKKMGSFVHALSDATEEEMRQFSEEIDADPKLKIRVREKVVLLLEQADDMEKAALLGKAFLAYIRHKVTYDQFSRMAMGINRAFISDIKRLSELKETHTTDYSWAGGLASAGLARATASAGFNATHNMFLIIETGRLVLEHCLDDCTANEPASAADN